MLNVGHNLGLAAGPVLSIGIAELLPAALMIGGLVLLFWAFRGRMPQGGGAAPSRYAGPGGDPRASAERLEGVLRDAEELGQLMAAQMDRQAERLERLIAEADARIRRMERMAAEAAQPRPAPRGDADPLAARVYDLADQGMPSVEIARQLDQQTGKVELILALRQR